MNWIICIIFAILLSLVSCQSPYMAEHFPDSVPVVLFDASGNMWLVEHHIGNTYTVKPFSLGKRGG